MLDFLYSGITILLFVIMLMAGFKKSNNEITPLVIIQRYNNLRGIFAIQIVVGHVIRYDNTLLYPFGKMMIVSVAFFFFVSSFGMVQSYYKKKNYLKGFLLSKCGYILILASAAYLFDIIISIIAFGKCGSLTSLKCFVINFFKCTNWYIWEIMIFYILFFVIFKYVKKYRSILFFTITILAVTFLFESGFSEMYYASSLGFPLGILAGEHFNGFCNFVYSFKGKITAAILTVLGLCSLIPGQNGLIGMVYMRNMICIAGLLILMYIFRSFEFNNRFLQITGKYSMEIYLFQFTWLWISESTGWDYKARIPLVLTITLITAYFMHFAFIPIQNMRKYIQTGCRE